MQHSTGTSVVMEQQPLYHGDEIVDKKCEDSSTTTGEGGERANGSDDDSVSEQDDNKEIGKAFVAQRKKKKKYKKRNMITEEKPYLTADNGSYYYVWPSEAEVASSLPVEPATMDVRRTLRKEGDIALAERQIISDAYSASHADPVRYEMCFQAAMNKMMNFNFVVHENDHGSSKHESNCVIKSHH